MASIVMAVIQTQTRAGVIIRGEVVLQPEGWRTLES